MKALNIPWQGIPIRITYEPDYSEAVKKIHGYQLAHITVSAKTALPITETGFRSIFMPDEAVQEAGGAVACVFAALDEAAKSKEWQAHVKERQQLKLF